MAKKKESAVKKLASVKFNVRKKASKKGARKGGG